MKKIYLGIVLIFLVVLLFFLSFPSNEGGQGNEILAEQFDPVVKNLMKRDEDNTPAWNLNQSIEKQPQIEINDFAATLADVSLDSFLIDEGDTRTLVTTSLANYSVEDLRHLVNNLGFDQQKDYLAYDTEYQLERKLNAIPAIQIDSNQCSSSTCAVIFSGQNKQDVVATLNDFIEDEALKAISGGGLIRHIEENGVSYGMLVLVFKNEIPLSIR